jgi:hypothetical protein
VDFKAMDGDIEVTLSDQPGKCMSESPPKSMKTESLRILSIIQEADEIEISAVDPKTDIAPLLPDSACTRHNESEGIEVHDSWLELVHRNTEPNTLGKSIAKTLFTSTSLDDQATDESRRIALKAVSSVKVPEIKDVLTKGTANRYYDKEIEQLEIANLNEKKKSSNVVEEKKNSSLVKQKMSTNLLVEKKGPSVVVLEDANFNTTIQGILRRSTLPRDRLKPIPIEPYGYEYSDYDPNIPSHLVFRLDDDFDGSTLTSSQTRKILEADNATHDSLSIGVAAWKEIYEASKVVESALKKFELDDDDTRSKLSLDENVMERLNSIDHIEAALEILKIHAERLGVKESDLLVAVKTDYDEEEEEEFEERSMTLGEEIFEALKTYGLFGGSKNK